MSIPEGCNSTIYNAGRKGTAWLNACKRVLANATHCEYCGKPLEFDAPPRSRLRPSVDHVIPLAEIAREYDVQQGIRMATDVSMLRAVHIGCNSTRSNRARGGNGKARTTFVPRTRYY